MAATLILFVDLEWCQQSFRSHPTVSFHIKDFRVTLHSNPDGSAWNLIRAVRFFSTMRLQSGVGKKIRSIMTFHCLTETVMFLSVTSFQIQFHAFKCCICAEAFQRSILAASLSPWKHEIPPQVCSIWYQWKAFQSFARFGQRCWCESKYLPAPNRITLTSLTHYLPLSAIEVQNSASFAGAVRQFAIN